MTRPLQHVSVGPEVELAPSEQTTLTLGETTASPQRSSLWLIWAGLGAAPPHCLGAPAVIGRGAEASLRLDCPGVSRAHAELYRQGPLVVVRDLGSRNGTFLNGERVEQAALSEGDVLRVGGAVGVIVRRSDDLGEPRTEELVPSVLFGPGLSAVSRVLKRVSGDALPIVIEGQTGVGKEGVARAIHRLSQRIGPFHAVNCGALPPALAEAELFGHRKGAFTGAEQPGIGHFRAAHGGTLLLDELYDLAPAVQTKLLRVLQEQQVVPLGETRAISVDVRIVAATPVALQELVASKRLREDLAARLAGVTLRIPPLSERRVDIPILLAHFLRGHSGGRPPSVDARLLEHLTLRAWPGNVRELELWCRRMLALHGHESTLRLSMLESRTDEERADEEHAHEPFPNPRSDTRDSAVTPPRMVRRAPSSQNAEDLSKLRERLVVHSNLSRAAEEAGISRQRAYRLLAGRSAKQLLEEASNEPQHAAADEADAAALAARLAARREE
jgi:DNA-binding NtrC family response regulator